MVIMKNPRFLILGLGSPDQSPEIQIEGMIDLSIRNFMLMINNHFARFQLPGNLLKTKKKCAPYFRAGLQFMTFFSAAARRVKFSAAAAKLGGLHKKSAASTKTFFSNVIMCASTS
jgi:hypothetical protein